MPSLLSNHSAFEVVETTNNTTEFTRTDPEHSGAVFLEGTPVQLTGGYVAAWDYATVAAGIAGVALGDGQNLGTSGAGFPGPFSPSSFPGTGTTFGSVPNQPNAVNIPEGAPFSIGGTVYATSSRDTIFRGQTDNNTGAATTPTLANVGTQYGISLDASNHAYIDFAKVTPGTNTVVEMWALDPIDGSIPNARILFKFLASAQQI